MTDENQCRPADVEAIAEALADLMFECEMWPNLDDLTRQAYRDRAEGLLTSPALATLRAHERAEGRREVGKAVCAWSIKNEIAEPPLDWAWLGEVVRWAGADVGDQSDRADRQEPHQ